MPLVRTLLLLAPLFAQGDRGGAVSAPAARVDETAGTGHEAVDAPRVEHFELVSEGRRVGLARRLRAVRDGRIELEEHWFDLDVRIYLSERRAATGPLLVWRELFAGGGRTVVLDRDPPHRSWVTTEWGSGPAIHRHEVPEGSVGTPLFALEGLRGGTTREYELPIFDPVAATFETLRPERLRIALPGGLFLDRVELTRGDGSSAGTYALLGSWLIGSRPTVEGPSARRVSPERYREIQYTFELRRDGSDPDSAARQNAVSGLGLR